MRPGSSHKTLIITPTRELALQVYNEARKFTQGSIIKPAVIYEDSITEQQGRKLGEGCNILVASVRALQDCVDQGKVSFTNIDILVLDEADRLFDTRQTVMFSSSFPDDVQIVAQDFLND